MTPLTSSIIIMAVTCILTPPTPSAASLPSWPGYDLTIGSSGAKVLQMQEQLNRIRQNYPAIPYITLDGIFGQQTAAAVRVFQRVFGLPRTGVVDFPTWYEISVSMWSFQNRGAFLKQEGFLL